LFALDLVPQLGDGDVGLCCNLSQKAGLYGFVHPARNPVTRLRSANCAAGLSPLSADFAHIFKTHAKTPRKLTLRSFAALIGRGDPHP
jgi:hypothetical protein